MNSKMVQMGSPNKTNNAKMTIHDRMILELDRWYQISPWTLILSRALWIQWGLSFRVWVPLLMYLCLEYWRFTQITQAIYWKSKQLFLSLNWLVTENQIQNAKCHHFLLLFWFKERTTCPLLFFKLKWQQNTNVSPIQWKNNYHTVACYYPENQIFF